jgi:hypothetical protein
MVDRMKDFLNEHDEQVDAAAEKAGDAIDERTDHKYDEQLDRGVDEVQKRTGGGDINPG